MDGAVVVVVVVVVLVVKRVVVVVVVVAVVGVAVFCLMFVLRPTIIVFVVRQHVLVVKN